MNFKFFIMNQQNKFLSKDNTWSSKTPYDDNTQQFDTEKAANDKVAALALPKLFVIRSAV